MDDRRSRTSWIKYPIVAAASCGGNYCVQAKPLRRNPALDVICGRFADENMHHRMARVRKTGPIAARCA